MDVLLYVIFLGIVQGVTEFLPISSSGHLALLENLPIFTEYQKVIDDQYSLLAFNVLLHIGTILAVIFFWRKDLREIIMNTITDIKTLNWQGDGIKVTSLIVIATLPVLTVPFFKDFVEETIYNLNWIAIFFILNALLLISSHLYYQFKSKKSNGAPKTIDSVTALSPFNALFIGVFQVFAVFPGISRSGSTITAGLLQNVKGSESVKFSFLLSIPVLLGAVFYEMHGIGFEKVFSEQMRLDWVLSGLIASFAAGMVSLKVLVWLGRNVLFYPFGIYTLILGVAILIIRNFI